MPLWNLVTRWGVGQRQEVETPGQDMVAREIFLGQENIDG